MPESLSQPDRARMAAALRMIDYVLIAPPDSVDSLLTILAPTEIMRLDDIEGGIFSRRLRRLQEHS
jgi:hypothetical protein